MTKKTNLVLGRLYKLGWALDWRLTFSGKEVKLNEGECLVFLSENYDHPVLTVVFLSPKFDETVECTFLFRKPDDFSLGQHPFEEVNDE